jgi:hypothetical protein
MLHAKCHVAVHQVLDSDFLLNSTCYFEFNNITFRLSYETVYFTVYTLVHKYQTQNHTVATNNFAHICDGETDFRICYDTSCVQFRPYIDLHSKNLLH